MVNVRFGVYLCNFILGKFKVMRVRIRLILVIFAVILLLAAESCSSQRYPARRAGHSRGCDCPKF
jgi:hypothetical protein